VAAGREAERDTELAIEVAPAERGVVVIGEPEARGGDAVAKRAQDTCLADTRFTDEDDGGALVESFEQRVDDDLLGRREPQVTVDDLLRERRLGERKVREVRADMSILLGGAMTGWASHEPVEQRAGGIEWHGVGLIGLGCRALAARLARGDHVGRTQHVLAAIVLDDWLGGADYVDGDGGQTSGQEALVKLPRHTGDIRSSHSD
jgi:hypothetical protein